MSKRVLVGVIKSAFGIKGELRIMSFCAQAEDILAYGDLCDESGRVYDITRVRALKGGFVGKINGLTTRSAAEALLGTKLYALRENMPALEGDEFYHSDLIGLDARTEDGQSFGHISAVFNHGAGDILEITRPFGTALLLAFTRANLPEINLERRYIVISLPLEL